MGTVNVLLLKEEDMESEAAPDNLPATSLRVDDSVKEANYWHNIANVGLSARFLLGVNNFTKYTLTPLQRYAGGGTFGGSQVNVRSGFRVAVIGMKTFGATGCWGIMSWKIGKTDKVLIVMYSVPFDQNLHTDWCGVGISKLTNTKNLIGNTKEVFNRMYYGEPGTWFKRQEFYKVIKNLEFEGDDTFNVSMVMGSSSITDMTVSFKPKFRKDLSDTFIN